MTNLNLKIQTFSYLDLSQW